MDAPVSDETLMLCYQDGDPEAFEHLYLRHRGPLLRYFKRQGVEAGISEELFQDVWMSLIRTRLNYRVQARFTQYLYRLAHNRMVDHFRRQRSHGEHASEWLEEFPAEMDGQPDYVAELTDKGIRLQHAVAALPAAQQEVFVLRAESGMEVDEIASALGIPYETAKSRLRYAVRKLSHRLRTPDVGDASRLPADCLGSSAGACRGGATQSVCERLAGSAVGCDGPKDTGGCSC